MKKTIAEHSERNNRHKVEEAPKGAVPHYLLDREQARGWLRRRLAHHFVPSSLSCLAVAD